MSRRMVAFITTVILIALAIVLELVECGIESISPWP
jgi:hypothetical protein